MTNACTARTHSKCNESRVGGGGGGGGGGGVAVLWNKQTNKLAACGSWVGVACGPRQPGTLDMVAAAAVAHVAAAVAAVVPNGN